MTDEQYASIWTVGLIIASFALSIAGILAFGAYWRRFRGKSQ